MRKRVPVLLAFLATAMLSVVAFAANDRVTAQFVSNTGSGVSGEVTINPMPKGGAMIHARIVGLTPNTDYYTSSYANGTCDTGSPTEIARFHSNGQGVARFNVKTEVNITDLQSLSVLLASDQSLKACAAVPQQ